MPPFLGQGMCSGIRDAQNLAFKLALVLDGRVGADLLDTYQLEREPHVRGVIKKGIELGRLQTTRDPHKAAERDRRLLAVRAQAGRPEKIRFPGLQDGFFAGTSGAGRGELSVQGVVGDGARRDRLDQVAGPGFQLLVDAAVLDALPADDVAAAIAAGVRVVALGVPEHRTDDALSVADVDATYARWFADLGCRAVVVRPDFYVYGTASDARTATALTRTLCQALTGGALRDPAYTPSRGGGRGD
jgi:3-(3-hydroxy-phenyl)propionate hydroxylase/flavoprotein hydroxylase